MQFVLYYAMTQRYFQMPFFGVQENLIFCFLKWNQKRIKKKELISQAIKY